MAPDVSVRTVWLRFIWKGEDVTLRWVLNHCVIDSNPQGQLWFLSKGASES